MAPKVATAHRGAQRLGWAPARRLLAIAGRHATDQIAGGRNTQMMRILPSLDGRMHTCIR